MSEPVNSSEKYVSDLCTSTFLSLWSFSNPPGKGKKELCDVLVVCDPYVIVISVKDIKYTKGADGTDTDYSRWQRKAVDGSVDQIYGAERWIASQSAVGQNQQRPLPPVELRKILRIAVAFGSEGWMPVFSRDFGKGFVHVFTEDSLGLVMRELDTISDFVHYLEARESFTGALFIEGADTELLGHYLLHNRKLEFDGPGGIVASGTWDRYIRSPEVKRKRQADQVSYTWDKLVEALASQSSVPVGSWNSSETEYERALRVLAKESRFNRRVLGEALFQFLSLPFGERPSGRIVVGPSGVIYVLRSFPNDSEPEFRLADLANRCFVARYLQGPGTVIGIGIGEYAEGRGSTTDLVYCEWPNWTEADAEQAARMQKDLNLFVNAVPVNTHHDEYPVSNLGAVSQEGRVKVGRNSPCPCGSGKKYKRCCL